MAFGTVLAILFMRELIHRLASDEVPSTTLIFAITQALFTNP